MEAIEPVATACNILANLVVMRAVCRSAEAPVPPLALSLQVGGNVAWCTYAILARDGYLLTTALTSLSLQVASLVMRVRKQPPRQAIPVDSSRESLRPGIW